MAHSPREQFQNQLGAMVEALDKRSLNYRAIGSVAAEANGIMKIDFTPRPAVDQIDQNPDLDIIIPRNELDGAREVRAVFEKDTTYPLKLGLAVPSMQVDLHPGEDESRLTWGRRSVPVDSRVFDATYGNIGDVPLRSVSAETLRHFYSSLSPQGAGGEKYQAKLAAFDDALGPDVGHESGDSYEAFHVYAELMKVHTPVSRRTMEIFNRATAYMTPEQRNRLRRVAFKLAGVAGWR